MKPNSLIPYRVQQVIWALTARPLKSEVMAELTVTLNAAELRLFQQFSVNDQNHGVRVFHLLKARANLSPALLKAGLLHDIGKTRSSLTVIDRSLAVAGKLLFSARTREWGKTSLAAAKRYQRPFVVRDQHAAWGAEMVEEIGCDPITVELIRRHQDDLRNPTTEIDQMLLILQWADDQS